MVIIHGYYNSPYVSNHSNDGPHRSVPVVEPVPSLYHVRNIWAEYVWLQLCYSGKFSDEEVERNISFAYSSDELLFGSYFYRQIEVMVHETFRYADPKCLVDFHAGAYLYLRIPGRWAYLRFRENGGK